MPSAATIAAKRTSMFGVLGNDSVWEKKDPTTLIFAILDAIAKEFGNIQDDVDGAIADMHLSTVTRINNLQARWGNLLKENLQGDLTVIQNIALFRNLLLRLVHGVEIGGITYVGSHPNNIRQLILDYSLVSECKVFEFWNNKISFAGQSIVDNSLVWNDITKQWNTGDTRWLDTGTLKALAYVVQGFQIFPEITGYARDTVFIERAVEILKPMHNRLGVIWCLNTPSLVGPLDIVEMEIGVGNTGGGGGCSNPVVTVPVIVQSLDVTKRVTPYPTLFHRVSAIVRQIDYAPAAEITEAILKDSTSAYIGSTYQTFSAIHKKLDQALPMSYYIQET